MVWIAITGGIGTGKSTASEILRTLGYEVLDADAYARQAVSPGSSALQEIKKTFGESSLNADGSLNRTWIAQQVFSDEVKRKKLEAITHPEVRRLFLLDQRRVEQGSKKKVAFYDVPLLFETGLDKQFDATLVITTSEKLQRARLQQRNGWDLAEIERRIKSQMPLAEKEKRATYVVHNTGDKKNLREQLEALISKI